MSTFTLKMELGNAAMLTGGDIADRLAVTADKIEATYGIDALDEWVGLGAFVRDTNGNQVGRWGIEDEKTPEQIAEERIDDNYESLDGLTQALAQGDVDADGIRSMIAHAVRVARGER